MAMVVMMIMMLFMVVIVVVVVIIIMMVMMIMTMMVILMVVVMMMVVVVVVVVVVGVRVVVGVERGAQSLTNSMGSATLAGRAVIAPGTARLAAAAAAARRGKKEGVLKVRATFAVRSAIVSASAPTTVAAAMAVVVVAVAARMFASISRRESAPAALRAAFPTMGPRVAAAEVVVVALVTVMTMIVAADVVAKAVMGTAAPVTGPALAVARMCLPPSRVALNAVSGSPEVEVATVAVAKEKEKGERRARQSSPRLTSTVTWTATSTAVLVLVTARLRKLPPWKPKRQRMAKRVLPRRVLTSMRTWTTTLRERRPNEGGKTRQSTQKNGSCFYYHNGDSVHGRQKRHEYKKCFTAHTTTTTKNGAQCDVDIWHGRQKRHENRGRRSAPEMGIG
mmetsp:Transcript_90153/g.179978  ORF Transcript_90153/g.179978 Transcript_90153/m.179978 type:complete len:393 (-) Transcript_90153:245-1423(-)